MLITKLLKLLKASNSTPEDFGKMIGVSGMTIRRWSKKPKSFQIPVVYVPAIRQACYQMVSEKWVMHDSEVVRSILIDEHESYQNAALVNLGLKNVFDPTNQNSGDQILLGLNTIGAQDDKQIEVENNQEKVNSFKKLGGEWEHRIVTLWEVIRSKKINFLSKLVAYGALFYLLTPIDFIPDHIPYFGVLDDFIILGVAVGFYANKLPKTVMN